MIFYKSYFYFFDADKNNTSTFQYQEFISSVPVHSKDKLGHNISILILQFLYLLKHKEFEQLYSKEDTLRKYAHTYLKTDHSKRSFYFFKLMLVVIRVDFDPEKSIRKGKPWFDKLKITPEPGDAYAEVEIIPYEKLWELLIEIMKEKPTRI